ncbi:hypothetical protein ABD87_14700 [Lysinibacillus sphaericus]|uniref:hypothetical protein n=1 Tax=Lysinibacillus sphaericus TaxID=1421 RepID=UPI0018CEFF56|nr:hypothetical protein [Lysinibacillus sphaericus]MBG9730749.1 hypothetical protein [Lysinibacillus sphaericus]
MFEKSKAKFQTIEMGLNTEPLFSLPDNLQSLLDKHSNTPEGLEVIKEIDRNDYFRIKEHIKALELKKKIEDACNQDGGCYLSFSYEGRTRHEWQSELWVEEMNKVNGSIYGSEIRYETYYCKLTLKDVNIG